MVKLLPKASLKVNHSGRNLSSLKSSINSVTFCLLSNAAACLGKSTKLTSSVGTPLLITGQPFSHSTG